MVGFTFSLYEIKAIETLAVCKDLSTIETTDRLVFSKQSVGVNHTIKSGKS